MIGIKAIVLDVKNKNMHSFKVRQIIPAPIADVFDFFSRAENLQKITPDFLHFKILNPLPIEMKVGAIIDYKLRIRMVPIKWKTRIEAWEPPHKFADCQIRGPYETWHHTHTFTAIDQNTTLMEDEVLYRVPFGLLGRLFEPFLVRPDVKRIFAYREKTVDLHFRNATANALRRPS